MDKHLPDIRILAIDLRLQRFGFVVLEGPSELLDWGVRVSPSGDGKNPDLVLRKRVRQLLSLFVPTVMVVGQVPLRKDRADTRYAESLQAVCDIARQQSVELALITRKEIRQAFATGGNPTKDVIATHLAKLFPDLAWSLPPKRRLYETERHTMTIFDAASIGITYLARFGDVISFLPGELRSPG